MSTNILMPALSPTMEEGKLAKWHVKEGDTVKSGDILAEIETDKATMEFEAVDEGKIGKLLVPEGAEHIKVNAPIAVLLEEGETAPKAQKPSAPAGEGARPSPKGEDGRVRGSTEPSQNPAQPLTRSPQATPATSDLSHKGRGEDTNGKRIFASPLAKRIAAQANVDIASVKGSGPRGRVVKADIEAAMSSGAARSAAPATSAVTPVARAAMAPAPALASVVSGIAPLPDARLFYKESEYEAVPHDSMRRSIAKRLSSAKALIPHYYLTIDCEIDELLHARARLNERAPKGEGAYKLSVNDFVVKAAAMALLRVPEVNASWTDDAILRHKHADVGVAVALDFGLITPIITHAEEKGLAVISNEVKSLAARAKDKKLKPSEYEGGSFAISNLGMFGIREFTAVINPPHAAILAVGAGEQRAVVKAGRVEAATVMTVTMSCDHRVIDGATGARFLQAFKAFVEEPASMLL
jgi:pyruvate dehydrogenase E2 component (dihydrolipoamide acetyltransferase)